METTTLLDQFAKGKQTVNKRTANCVIYTRVSTKEQADTNMSLTTQLKHCEQYAIKQQYSIKGIFGGTYESAKDDERKEFNRMLSFVKKSKEKISYIIVYSVDRFSRSGANAIYIKEKLKSQGVHILAVSQITDTETPSGNLQQNIQFIFSEYDNQIRKEKSMNGTKEALLRGEWTQNTPIGYDNLKLNGKRKLVVNAKGKLIKKAFEWKAYEQITNEEVRIRLEKLGLKIPRQTMSDILRNPFYCGYMSHNFLEGKVVKGNHEALITPDLFFKVHNVNLGRHKFGYKVKSMNDNIPLKNFLKCDHCNCNVPGYIVQKKGIWYYKCRNKGCKNNKSAKDLHKVFESILTNFMVEEPELIDLIKEQFVFLYNKTHDEVEDNKSVIENKIKELDSKIARLELRYIEEDLGKDLFTKYKQQYTDERMQFVKELENFKIEVSNLDKCLEIVFNYSKNLSVLWASSGYEEKVKIQYMLFPEGIYYNKKTNECRTKKVSSVWSYIALLKQDSEGNKKGITDLNISYADLVQWVGQLSNFLSASLLRFEKLTPGSLKNDFEVIKAALKPD
jgi:site-specific DNA recombinase